MPLFRSHRPPSSAPYGLPAAATSSFVTRQDPPQRPRQQRANRGSGRDGPRWASRRERWRSGTETSLRRGRATASSPPGAAAPSHDEFPVGIGGAGPRRAPMPGSGALSWLPLVFFCFFHKILSGFWFKIFLQNFFIFFSTMFSAKLLSKCLFSENFQFFFCLSFYIN